MNNDYEPDDFDAEEDFDDEDEFRGPSRSQQKRDHKALRDLVRALVALPPATLATLPIEPGLAEQLHAAKQLVPKALNREIRYLTRQLVDADPEALRTVIERHHAPHKMEIKALHAAEHLRDTLIAGDDAALSQLFDRHPSADRQQLRQLVRAARKEHAAGAAPKAARKLFKALHALENAASTGGDSAL